jgi:hypothetical protein
MKQITWNWTDNSSDEDGFKVWADAGNGAPTTLRTTTADDATAWLYTGLAINAQYSFQVAANNLSGDSARTDPYTTWTLAATPAAPGVSNPSAATLNVTIGAGDGNPAGTEYALHCESSAQWVQTDGTLGAAAAWGMAAEWRTKTVTGLHGATGYRFRVRARNGAKIETQDGPAVVGETQCRLTYTAGPGGSIAGALAQSVDYGTNGTAVAATPDNGYHFAQWSDGKTANPRTDVGVTADMNVTANFAMDGRNAVADWMRLE